MFFNYLKMTLRNFSRHKGYSILNIAGLSIGMATCILMLMWVQDELSYDKFHQNGSNLYRVVQEAQHSGKSVDLCRTPPNLGPVLESRYPEIEASARCWLTQFRFVHNNMSFEENILLVDPAFLKMFSFDLIRGDTETALTEMRSVIMTSRAAGKIFGNEAAYGNIVQSSGGNDYKVTGILENTPANSHLQFDFLMPFSLLGDFGEQMWRVSNNPMYTYVQRSPGSPLEEINNKIAGVITEHATEVETRLWLQPLEKIHLYSHFTGDIGGQGDIKYIYIFIVAAIFILGIACINFMNLATARSSKRALEVGLRKVVGADRSQLIRQFLGESLLLSFLALLGAVTLVLTLLPKFNQLSGKSMSIQPSDWTPWLAFLGVTLMTGLVAGSYPALVLSGFKPVTVLKGKLSVGARSATFRKLLVILQFSLSVILMIGTLVIYNQLTYMRHKKLGFEKKHLVYFSMNRELREKYDAMKTEMLQSPLISSVSYGSHVLTDVTHIHGNMDWEGKDPTAEVPMNCLMVENDFPQTMDMEIISGRSFSKEMSTDETGAFIVNEEAVRIMGVQDPIGLRVKYGHDEGQIIGVVKDFHFKPLTKQIEPMILINSPRERFFMFVRVGENLSAAIEAMRSVWDRFTLHSAFEYRFMDATLDEMYRSEERVGTLFQTFSLLAIAISCLGLLGLAAFMAEQRTKEIGIRKVLGASIPQLLFLLSKDFTKWIIVANLIAWPVAYFVMERWLQQFVYRTDIGIGTMLLASLIALIIAWTTVSYQSMKAALIDPVDSIQHE